MVLTADSVGAHDLLWFQISCEASRLVIICSGGSTLLGIRVRPVNGALVILHPLAASRDEPVASPRLIAGIAVGGQKALNIHKALCLVVVEMTVLLELLCLED